MFQADDDSNMMRQSAPAGHSGLAWQEDVTKLGNGSQQVNPHMLVDRFWIFGMDHWQTSLVGPMRTEPAGRESKGLPAKGFCTVSNWPTEAETGEPMLEFTGGALRRR